MNRWIDFEKVNEAALPHLRNLLEKWFPNGKVVGKEFEAGDWDGNLGQSLHINIKKGIGGDFATGEMASGAIAIYAKRFKSSRYDAAVALAKYLNIYE